MVVQRVFVVGGGVRKKIISRLVILFMCRVL
jgi:hypothetical protein